MRFVIHEQPYEQPLATGQFRYLQNGEPTGAIESWRLSAAVDGYRFLRVDLDARAAESGRSYLFHMVLNPDNRPEQLKYLVFAQGLSISGAIVWEADDLAGARTVNDTTFEDVVPRGEFWFPSVMGLSILSDGTVSSSAPVELPGATLQTAWDEVAGAFRLYHTPVWLAKETTVAADGSDLMHLQVMWSDEKRELWLGSDGYPLRLSRPDGLQAEVMQFLAYT